LSTIDQPSTIEWVVSSSPHLRERETTSRIMWTVVLALAPAGIWAVWFFGWPALYVMALCVGSCMATEALVQKMSGRPVTISDGSAAVTGLLLAYCLHSHSVVAMADGTQKLILLKWYVPVIGSIAAIAIAKHCFGGLGHNIWNPALVGRAVVQLSFAKHVSLPQWPWPLGITAETATDAMTRATALAPSAGPYSVRELFIGTVPGCLGEVSAFFLLLGAVVLLFRKYIDWRLPLGYLLSLVVLATLFAWSPNDHLIPWVHDFAVQFKALRAGEVGVSAFGQSWLSFAARQIFAGGVILGAFYMATDMVTSPLSHKGQFVYGIGCGVLTALIRFYAGYPEGVCYSILIMNTLRPYVDRFTRPRVLGEMKE